MQAKRRILITKHTMISRFATKGVLGVLHSHNRPSLILASLTRSSLTRPPPLQVCSGDTCSPSPTFADICGTTVRQDFQGWFERRIYLTLTCECAAISGGTLGRPERRDHVDEVRQPSQSLISSMIPRSCI